MIRLSICMIVKNEERNLAKCLNSLADIRQKIATELIIVDTGSCDGTVEIAKAYTEHVHFHEWNYNFSDMRNISIGYATGEWIMIIDADEVITAATGIVEVLSDSSLLGRHNTLLIRTKDYTKHSDETAFFEYVAPRFFKNDGSFHYQGSIHNQPMMKEPVWCIPVSVLNHFGYDSDDESLMAAKVERTAAMLKKELEMNPNDIYYLYQLSSIFRMGKKYEEALSEIEKAFELVVSEGISRDNVYVVKQYILSLKDFELNTRVSALREMLGSVIDQDLDLSFYYADTMMKLNQTVYAKQHYERYLELLDDHLKGENSRIDLSDKIQTSNLKDEACIGLAGIEHAQKNHLAACRYYNQVSLERFTEQTLGNFVESLMVSEEHGLFGDFVTRLAEFSHPALNSAVIAMVEETMMALRLEDLNSWAKSAKALSVPYEILLLAREAALAGEKLDADDLQQYFKSYFTRSEPFYADFLYFTLQNGQGILELLSKYTSIEINAVVNYLNSKHDDFKAYAVEMLESSQSSQALKVKTCIEMILLSDESIESEIKTAIGIDCILNKIEWLYRTYQRDALENKVHLLSGEDRNFAELNLSFMGALQLESIRPRFTGPAGEVLFQIIEGSWDELFEALRPIRELVEIPQRPSVSEEFADLKRLIIGQLDQFEKDGAYAAGLSVLEEYLKIVPTDRDMLSRKTRLEEKAVRP